MLIAIIAIVILIFLITFLICIVVIYNIKKKYGSIDRYNKQQDPNKKTYEDNIKDFKEIQYKMGIKNRKNPTIWQIIKKYISNKIDKSA